eukprot:TRINITY_DN7901_c0_g1_i6.p1 TRINITY_DN7901_c0_g1~~TRINITY_DN7901_c0_g1_i6.p1  ORF type:complete len:1402 (-),score=275.12 TRINITY_DN7901_c0_g1_i6:521-4726(-)
MSRASNTSNSGNTDGLRRANLGGETSRSASTDPISGRRSSSPRPLGFAHPTQRQPIPSIKPSQKALPPIDPTRPAEISPTNPAEKITAFQPGPQSARKPLSHDNYHMTQQEQQPQPQLQRSNSQPRNLAQAPPKQTQQSLSQRQPQISARSSSATRISPSPRLNGSSADAPRNELHASEQHTSTNTAPKIINTTKPLSARGVSTNLSKAAPVVSGTKATLEKDSLMKRSSSVTSKTDLSHASSGSTKGLNASPSSDSSNQIQEFQYDSEFEEDSDLSIEEDLTGSRTPPSPQRKPHQRQQPKKQVVEVKKQGFVQRDMPKIGGYVKSDDSSDEFPDEEVRKITEALRHENEKMSQSKDTHQRSDSARSSHRPQSPATSTLSQQEKKPEYVRTSRNRVGPFSSNPSAPSSNETISSSLSTHGKKSSEHILILRLKSNWGHPSSIGLTELEVYDINERVIIEKEDIKIIDPDGIASDFARLTNGVTKTTSERSMWSVNVPKDMFPIDVQITLTSFLPSDIHIWNYNEAQQGSSKGVREMEIFLNGTSIWAGDLPQGPGHTQTEYRHVISAGHNGWQYGREYISIVRMPVIEDSVKPSRKVLAAPSGQLDDASEAQEKPKQKIRDLSESPPDPSQLHKDDEMDDSLDYDDRKLSDAYAGRIQDHTQELDVLEIEEFLRGFSNPAISGVVPTKSLQQSMAFGASGVLSGNYDISNPLAASGFMPTSEKAKLATFEIPVLPSGMKMSIEITSTWGDKHYVGMTGIDIFDSRGNPVKIQNISKQVRADPPDINILPGDGKDPRTIDKLFDGINSTCDDRHMWLAPFKQGQINLICIDFEKSIKLSMLRFWNYNKSRIHTQRGVRSVSIKLDGKLIFQGEIRCASGELHDADANAEVVLFTFDNGILSLIESFDAKYHKHMEVQTNVQLNSSTYARPMTAGQKSDSNAPSEKIQSYLQVSDRPVTSAIIKPPPRLASGPRISVLPNAAYPRGIVIRLEFLTTWGDMTSFGLSGLQVFDGDGNCIPVLPNMLTASPCDMRGSTRPNSDMYKLSNLVNNNNVTVDGKQMWMAPFKPGGRHVLCIKLSKSTSIAGLKIWNFNQSLEDTYCGVQKTRIYIDDKLISEAEGVTIRKAPGLDDFDFGQLIYLDRIGEAHGMKQARNKVVARTKLSDSKLVRDIPIQDCEVQLFPTGYTLKFVFSSTWGDMHYLGLNGIELFGMDGNPIKVSTDMCHAVPRDVRVVTELRSDSRVLENLFNGVNDTYNDHNMWLTPFDAGKDVVLYIFFDAPVTLSMIRFWNYSKTPSRGANDVDILLDEMLVFKGQIRQAPARQERANSSCEFACCVLFTNDIATIERERSKIYPPMRKERDVSLFDEQRCVYGSEEVRQQTKAVSLVPQNLIRPTTTMAGARK